MKNKVITDHTTTKNRNMLKNCVNCQQSSFRTLVEGYDFDTGEKAFSVESCSKCRLARTNPVLGDAELSSYYESGYYGSSEQKFNPLIESWTIWSNKRLASNILSSYKDTLLENRNGIKVLDVGCGRANLLKAFKRLGCQCYGIERSEFPSDSELDGINIYKQDISKAPIEENSLDIVVIWHVLEHLTDPAAAINRIQKLLKPGGLLVLAVPNFGGFQSKLFGKHWFHLDLPRHTYHFTKPSIESIFQQSGLSIESISTSSLDQSIFGFVQSALNMIGLGKPNTLYSILKTAHKKPNAMMSVFQILVASILLPISSIEYVTSCIVGRGACLIVKSKKLRQTND